MVVNMNMHSQEKGNINDYLADTIAAVFPRVYTVDVPGSTNRELFAGSNADMVNTAERNIQKLADSKVKSGLSAEAALADMLTTACEGLKPYEKGTYLLTDDKAPVELLGMQVIDGLIQSEIGYYKEIFQKEGLEGLLNSM